MMWQTSHLRCMYAGNRKFQISSIDQQSAKYMGLHLEVGLSCRMLDRDLPDADRAKVDLILRIFN